MKGVIMGKFFQEISDEMAQADLRAKLKREQEHQALLDRQYAGENRAARRAREQRDRREEKRAKVAT